MTACAFDAALAAGPTGALGAARRRPAAFTIAADGSYGARLALSGEAGCWFPERWTLDGPEPYAVPLPAAQPEEPDSEVLPLADGQVLIRRRVAGRHTLSLLYPAGPGTGERPLGAVECAELSLLPPAPGGSSAFALGQGERSTSVWLVHGGGFGPQHLAEVPGRCTGGIWLDRTGRLLALDRRLDGRTKTVVVDLRRGGETSPLLQITDDSDDRLLLADPDSGLLLVRSDAPGDERLGWGVLGSARPVRFPDCLRPAQAEATPFAVQPGQVLTPEACAVAFRMDGPVGRPWVGLWRPSERRLRQLPAPEGWLAGAGLWSRDGELRLPYATGQVPCGLARLRMPEPPEPPRVARIARVTRVDRVVDSLELPRPVRLVEPARSVPSSPLPPSSPSSPLSPSSPSSPSPPSSPPSSSSPSAASSPSSSSPSLAAGVAVAAWTRVGAGTVAPGGETGVEPWAGTGSWAGVEQETGPEAEPGPEAGKEPRRDGGPGSGPPSGAERGRERVPQREREQLRVQQREHVRVREEGLVGEQGGIAGREPGQGPERLPERLPAHRLRPGPGVDLAPEPGVAARPVPLQQAPLARRDQLRPSHPSHQPRPPRPPRWVRDRRSG
ncbi:hypothetical protein ACI2L4_10290 [Streptomyces sparsogenes]|uniref:hypothetical protein n=1 Tax=Streptomyces sparsogenes TaxID=67365 RepID=UPI0034080475